MEGLIWKGIKFLFCVAVIVFVVIPVLNNLGPVGDLIKGNLPNLPKVNIKIGDGLITPVPAQMPAQAVENAPAPTSTPAFRHTQVQVADALSSLNRQTFVYQDYTDQIEVMRECEGLGLNCRRATFNVGGRVEVGIDFGLVEAYDIQVLDSDSLVITLPSPVIFDDQLVIDVRETELVDAGSRGLIAKFRKPDYTLTNDAEREGRRVILEHARENSGSLMEKTKEKATDHMKKVFEQIGYTDVQVNFR